MSKHFVKTEAKALDGVLKLVSRQYLAGNLQLPQELPFVNDTHLEIGVTHYSKQTAEAPHWHSQQREYQYMLSGETVYTEIPHGTKLSFKQGDFYAILPTICYSQDSIPGTRILFIKHPAINDKVTCPRCPIDNCPYRIQPFSGVAKKL